MYIVWSNSTSEGVCAESPQCVLVCTEGVCMCVCRVQAGQSLSVSGSLQFNAQFESGNLRKAIQVDLVTHQQSADSQSTPSPA